MMQVKGRSAVRRDLADEVVDGASSFVARELEHQVTPWAGLKAQPFVRCQRLGCGGRGGHLVPPRGM
jgi:hypothetical protein